MAQRRKTSRKKPARKAPADTKAKAATSEAHLVPLRQAMRLHMAGQLAAAIPFYRQALEQERSLAALNNIGAALRDLKRPEEAVPLFREAMDLDPDFPDAPLNLGLCLLDAGDDKAAAPLLKHALDLLPPPAGGKPTDPRTLQAINGYGSVLRRQNKRDEVVALYRDACAKAPGDTTLRTLLDGVLSDRDRRPDAGGPVEPAAVIEDQIAAGAAAFGRGDAAGAERIFRMVLAAHPDSPEAVLNLGAVLKHQHRLPEALDCFQQAVRLRPAWAPAYANLAAAYCDLGRLDEAEAACRKAIELDPKNRNAYGNLALVFTARRQDAEAIRLFEQAIAIGPPTAGLYTSLAAAFVSLGRLADAVKACRQAIALQPDFAEANAILAHALASQARLQGPTDAARHPVLPAGGETLFVRIKGNVQVCVSNDIDQITPYVLLEQEGWFEAEASFVARLLRPGDRMIDIGANHGVYSLPAARAVGPGGRVWSFEPARRTAALLTASVKANAFANMTIIEKALSDREGEATLSVSANSELNTLHGKGEWAGAEKIVLTTLDTWAAANGWPAVDFIKLDAEGEEPNVIRGGVELLKRSSPLIMFEVKHGDEFHLTLLDQFAALGYRTFRLIPGLGLLAPVREHEIADGYLLNLFCCKADRAAALAERGLLVAEVPAFDPDDIDRAEWVSVLSRMPYAKALIQTWKLSLVDEPEYETALTAYCHSRSDAVPLPQRVAALGYAVANLRPLAEARPSFASLMSVTRAAQDFGQRGMGVAALRLLRKMLDAGAIDTARPFLAPAARFDAVPCADLRNWCTAAVLETLASTKTYSSFFGELEIPLLESLRKTGLHDPRFDRDRQLMQMRRGLPVERPLPARLLQDSPENLNAPLWRALDASAR